MPSDDRQALRQSALEVVKRLRAAGHQAIWAGGCVRDQLLGIDPKDYDIATSAPPDEVRRIFGRRQTLPIGASFGVITLLGSWKPGQIEVATFRSEQGYSDGRRPDHVEFTTAEFDAQRRDFTINGLFYDPVAEEVIDYVGGRDDLAAGIVRAIGDPDERIGEDKLRMLRAVRFAARFGFDLEPKTRSAIRQRARELSVVSGERIGAELRSMLLHPHRAQALTQLRDTRLLDQVLPELTGVAADQWDTLLAYLRRIELPTLPLVLAAILRVDPLLRVEPVIAERWRLPKRESERADWLLDQISRFFESPTLPWPRLQRLLLHPGARELVDLGTAIAGHDDPAVRLWEAKLLLPPDQLNPAPIVSGNDLMAHGIPPGPRMGELLEAVRDAQLERQIETFDEAIDLAQRLFRERPPST